MLNWFEIYIREIIIGSNNFLIRHTSPTCRLTTCTILNWTVKWVVSHFKLYLWSAYLCEAKGTRIMNKLEKQRSQSWIKKEKFNKSLVYPEVPVSQITSKLKIQQNCVEKTGIKQDTDVAEANKGKFLQIYLWNLKVYPPTILCFGSQYCSSTSLY